ncbi:hypothetical protein GCM10018785_47750 [Streptomyces longispororuber]|uniref:Uncharacterized protein n=1 Tax=Streptomyces longispororuber TaxID=68230 RepID=A0A918ZWH7_9ACTN|nr:hypothetical protein GCM10018785_47750 [Streptomyces longispororuber]
MSFEGHRLNDMIDLVEHANPADLESAGEALKKARDAIATAAAELGDHIDRVDWEGEAGRAFRKWGKKLVKETHQLSDFADVAGAQIASAGAGLASVRSSMPPRDTRTDPKAVEDIPTPKRVDGNEEYQAAVKAEKHRQEAINQMNRLASFYRVSQHEMATQEPPTFSAMPDVGVPRPQAGGPGDARSVPRAVPTIAGGPPSSVPHEPADPPPPTHGGPDRPFTSPEDLRAPITPLDRPAGADPVGTKIDSIDPLPPQPAGPSPSSSPSGPGPTNTPGGPLPLPGGNPVKPLGGPPGRAYRPGAGEKPPLPVQGRPGAGEPTGRSGRSPSEPVARTVPVAPGRGGNVPITPVQAPAGRGMPGSTSQPRDVPSPRSGVPGITGTPRADGVVGGRPAPGPTAGLVGPRTPRGPAIGAEGVGNSRTGGGPGPRGIVGATPIGSGAGPRHAGRNSDGVVGTPTGRTGTARGYRNGFTPGGTGLVRGSAGGHRRSKDEDETTQRPDYLLEDEETHLPNGRRQVPPVID